MKPVTPDCSPIPLKTSTNSTKSSRLQNVALTPQQGLEKKHSKLGIFIS